MELTMNPIHDPALCPQTSAETVGIRALRTRMRKRWPDAPSAVSECEYNGIWVSTRSMQDWLAGRASPNADTALRIHNTFFSDTARARELASRLSDIVLEISELQAGL